jgi:hypothetical protein
MVPDNRGARPASHSTNAGFAAGQAYSSLSQITSSQSGATHVTNVRLAMDRVEAKEIALYRSSIP